LRGLEHVYNQRGFFGAFGFVHNVGSAEFFLQLVGEGIQFHEIVINAQYIPPIHNAFFSPSEVTRGTFS
jgi:hypothetical protein